MHYLKGIIFLIFLLVLSRIIPHPPNFTPILAGLIFLPFIKKDISFSVIVPLSAMLISDFFIGMHSLMLWTYIPILVISFISYYFYETRIKRVGALAISSPVIFFVISNFGVWLNSASYSNDLDGLIACYINAIPFYANSAVACILFSLAFYAAIALAKKNNIAVS